MAWSIHQLPQSKSIAEHRSSLVTRIVVILLLSKLLDTVCHFTSGDDLRSQVLKHNNVRTKSPTSLYQMKHADESPSQSSFKINTLHCCHKQQHHILHANTSLHPQTCPRFFRGRHTQAIPYYNIGYYYLQFAEQSLKTQ